MKAIQTLAKVTADGKVVIQLPSDVTPGEHMAVLVIDEAVASHRESDRCSLDDFPVDSVGPWPSGLSLRREDLYGERGR